MYRAGCKRERVIHFVSRSLSLMLRLASEVNTGEVRQKELVGRVYARAVDFATVR